MNEPASLTDEAVRLTDKPARHTAEPVPLTEEPSRSRHTAEPVPPTEEPTRSRLTDEPVPLTEEPTRSRSTDERAALTHEPTRSRSTNERAPLTDKQTRLTDEPAPLTDGARVAAHTRTAAQGFVELGLTAAEAAVLQTVIASQEATAGTLAAATGLSESHVSTAISGLRRRGLLDRVIGRRPSVVFVRHDADVVAQAMADEAERARRTSASRVTAATRLLHDAALQAASRRRPMYEIRAATDPVSPLYDVLRLGRTAHHEVLPGHPAATTPWRPAATCPTRLLVTMPCAGVLSELHERLAGDRGLRLHPVEVRATDVALPDLLLLDGERVRVGAGSSYGRVHAWSREPLHVRWAEHLFAAWWADAEPAFDVPPTSIPPFDESALEVDEWDPTEVWDTQD